MAADAQTILNNINEIYTSELGRAADPGGAEFYSNLVRGGTSLEDIRAQISGSAEGRAFDQSAISNIYQSELGRAVDPGGMEYYTGLLNQGVSPNEIRRQINVSDEGKAFDRTTVAGIMASQLGRINPDLEGLNFYTNLLQQGTPIADVVDQINRSPEGRAYDLSVLKDSFERAFNRPPDAEGQNYWLGRMQEDPSINEGTLMDFLKGGAKGADVPGTGTKTNVPPPASTPTPNVTQPASTTTTNVVPANVSTTPRFDTTMANQVIPQTIGPGGGAIETQIRQGILPQQVVIGGAPVNISGGYGAYPYGIESLAQTFSTPANKLRNVASNAAPMTAVYAPVVGGTATPGINYLTQPFSSFAAPTTAAPPRAVDFYTNPYAGPYNPAPFKSPYGPIAGSGGVTVAMPQTTATTTPSPNTGNVVI